MLWPFLLAGGLVFSIVYQSAVGVLDLTKARLRLTVKRKLAKHFAPVFSKLTVLRLFLPTWVLKLK